MFLRTSRRHPEEEWEEKEEHMCLERGGRVYCCCLAERCVLSDFFEKVFSDVSADQLALSELEPGDAVSFKLLLSSAIMRGIY